MKRTLLTGFVTLGVLGSAFGQSTAPQRRSLSMDVRPMSSGGGTKSGNSLNITTERRPAGAQGLPVPETVTTENYSSSRKRGSGVGLQVEVRNLGRTADQARVEWYFLGKPVTRGEQFVFDEGSQIVSLNSASRQLVDIQSAELTSTVEKSLTMSRGTERNYFPSASTRKSGSRVAGWIVRLVADDQVLQVRASAPSLEAIGKDSAKLAALPRDAAPRK